MKTWSPAASSRRKSRVAGRYLQELTKVTREVLFSESATNIDVANKRKRKTKQFSFQKDKNENAAFEKKTELE